MKKKTVVAMLIAFMVTGLTGCTSDNITTEKTVVGTITRGYSDSKHGVYVCHSIKKNGITVKDHSWVRKFYMFEADNNIDSYLNIIKYTDFTMDYHEESLDQCKIGRYNVGESKKFICDVCSETLLLDTNILDLM